MAVERTAWYTPKGFPTGRAVGAASVLAQESDERERVAARSYRMAASPTQAADYWTDVRHRTTETDAATSPRESRSNPAGCPTVGLSWASKRISTTPAHGGGSAHATTCRRRICARVTSRAANRSTHEIDANRSKRTEAPVRFTFRPYPACLQQCSRMSTGAHAPVRAGNGAC